MKGVSLLIVRSNFLLSGDGEHLGVIVALMFVSVQAEMGGKADICFRL